MGKVLIIKTGNSELLEYEFNNGISLGDVFRTTVLLNIFEDDEVYWLTSKYAKPLIDNNNKIKKVLTLGEDNNLIPYKVDLVINLEKGDGFCALTKGINAKEKFGFIRDNNEMKVLGNHSNELIELITNLKKRKDNKKSISNLLFNLLNRNYNRESYLLSYKPKTNTKYDIGFNFHVGSKWQTKGYPLDKWQQLEALLLKEGLSVSWQQGMSNINEYIDWINSCKLIITSDSLGLHLALGLNKKIVALFGPTSKYEIEDNENMIKIIPDKKFDCMPCFLPKCKKDKSCMEFIDIFEIKMAVDGLIGYNIKK